MNLGKLFFNRPALLSSIATALALTTSALLPVSDAPRRVPTSGLNAGTLRGPAAPSEWFAMQRTSADGTIDLEARDAALGAARSMAAFAAESSGASAELRGGLPDFLPSGPLNTGGRIADIVADPANPTTVWVGAASGGVWKSTDNGATWSSSYNAIGGLSVGALAMDPTNPNIVYVGSGEANPGGGSIAYGGTGIYKTTDAGSTWAFLGLGATRSIGRIVVDPVDPSRVFVAATGNLYTNDAERGVYRSTNSGASFERVLAVSDSTGCVDIAIDPANPSRIFAATWERIRRPSLRQYGGVTSGLYRSTDGGNNWSILAGGLPLPAERAGRIGVALAPSLPSTVYAIYANEDGTFRGFFRSTNSGDSWARRTDSDLEFGSFYSTYGWWFGRLWVHPTNAQTVWADGVGLYRTANGGNAWADVTGSIHVDHHAQWIQPTNPNVQWKGNDGGLYRTSNGGNTWTHVQTLPIAQFYAIEAHISEPQRIYGGLQDNGTWRSPVAGGTSWLELPIGGDGFHVNVDINTTSRVYGEYQYGVLSRSTNGGASFVSATNGISASDRKNWSTPVVMDPATLGAPATTLYYGANRLYRSTNNAANWSVVSPDLSDGNPGQGGVVYGTITTIAVAPSNAQTIYVGTDDANVWVTTNGGANWTKVDASLPERWVTRVAVDPANDATAYVTLSGYRNNDEAAHVFQTQDWGATWIDISENLPGAPVNDIVVDPSFPNRLFVATDVGAYFTNLAGTAWSILGGSSLVGIVVTDLDYIDSNPPLLHAGTYGRSTFTFDAAALSETVGIDDALAAGTPPRGGVVIRAAAPNPTRGPLSLTLDSERAGHAAIDIVDVAGRSIARISEGELPAGRSTQVWNGKTQAGGPAASGVYFVRVRGTVGTATVRFVVTK